MNKYTRQTLVVLTGLTVIWQASGQRKIASYEQYIDRYNHLAVEQEKKYHIPASIKLAQAILESDAGRAKLAREANNHFGIKCHNNWKGKKTYHDDDLRNECFRTYGSVTDSYEDHSRFLAERSRYTKLFLLNKKDYRGWAKGLQQCGYATDRAYANKLIKLIEDYELYLYDMGGKSGKKASSSKKEASKKRLKKESVQPKISSANDGERLLPRNVYKTYGLIYIIPLHAMTTRLHKSPMISDSRRRSWHDTTKYAKIFHSVKATSSIWKRKRRRPKCRICSIKYRWANPCTAFRNIMVYA